MIILIDQKTRKGDLCKSQGSKDKVTASGQAQSTCGIQSSKDFRFEASAKQRPGTGAIQSW